jgi:methionine-S-sulfoxide reductase
MTRLRLCTFVFVCASLLACQTTGEVPPNGDGDAKPKTPEAKPVSVPATSKATAEGTQLAPGPKEGQAVATFAGGCFWCMEGPFEKLDGVSAVFSGYTAGPEKNPTYAQVSGKLTDHTEAVIVYYDPAKVTYEKLMDTFWRSLDPTDAGGQFADRGRSYRPAIFVHNEAQRAAATKSKAELEASGRFSKPIVVPIQDAEPFWVAEEYHQDYYKKEPDHYGRYRRGSGRAGFLAKHW